MSSPWRQHRGRLPDAPVERLPGLLALEHRAIQLLDLLDVVAGQFDAPSGVGAAYDATPLPEKP